MTPERLPPMVEGIAMWRYLNMFILIGVALIVISLVGFCHR